MEIFGGVKKSCVGSDPQNTTVSFPWCGRLPLFILIYTLYMLAAPKILFFWPAFVTRLLTPRSRKSSYGLLLGCRSPLDGGHEKKLFLCFSS